jgi:hypothetical protein
MSSVFAATRSGKPQRPLQGDEGTVPQGLGFEFMAARNVAQIALRGFTVVGERFATARR